MAIGSRYIPGGSIPHWPWYRRVPVRYGNLYTRLALGLKARDLTSGFRAWKASTLENIDYKTTNATGYLFQMEMAYRVAQHGEQRRRGADHVHRSGAGHVEDVRRGDLRRADAGDVVGLRDRWHRLRRWAAR